MINVEIDDCFLKKNNRYTIKQSKEQMLLKRIYIKKKQLSYAFIGGMWYSKEDFSLENNKISLPYPFKSYYTTKILDKEYETHVCRSLYYVKMPLLVLQFKDECVSVEFDPLIKFKKQEIFPFICLHENKEHYIVSFYLYKSFTIKEKNNAWLGLSKKRKITLDLKEGDKFNFSVKTNTCKNWEEPVKKYTKTYLTKDKQTAEYKKDVFKSAESALFRSYDDITGSFIQLPWSNSPDFSLVNSSYSLLSSEAVRLHYFTRFYKETNDEQFDYWAKKIRNHFTNPQLYIENPRQGKGIIWYNMTNLTKKGLSGFFYMDCGYSGYPGGQATIAYHLLKYIDIKNDPQIEKLVKKSLDYILSTQRKNGSWPMAISQEGKMRFRPERLSEHETYGGTSECARALLEGFKRFKNKEFKKSAEKALNFLETKNPICYNGLRDIGVEEAEAYSAVIAIDAFLDAYQATKEKKYLENALNYAHHTLTWFYLYNTGNLTLNYNFHPISYSITPRLSPYENLLIINAYLRIFEITKEKFWKQITEKTYTQTTKWITKNGGLSEGIFPSYLSKLESLPMEQTFATVELMNVSRHFGKIRAEKDKTLKEKRLEIKKEKNQIIIEDDGKKILSFNTEKCKIEYIRGAKLNRHGISFSFYDSYRLKNRMNQKIKQAIRGNIGKYILGLPYAIYSIKGVYNKELGNIYKIDSFEKYVKNQDITEIDKNKIKVICRSNLHEIECSITSFKKGEKVVVSFKPLIVRTLAHDLSCKKILFPVVGKKILKKDGQNLYFDGFNIKTDFEEVITKDSFTAVDQTLSTNWTHGGIYIGSFDLIINEG